MSSKRHNVKEMAANCRQIEIEPKFIEMDKEERGTQ